MKVEELAGIELDRWVAKAEGVELSSFARRAEKMILPDGEIFSPSTNWAQGGPIIEREVIDLSFSMEYGYVEASIFVHGPGPADVDLAGQAQGYSPLVAAMRAFVISKFGETVPDEAPALDAPTDLYAAAQHDDAYGAGHLDGQQ